MKLPKLIKNPRVIKLLFAWDPVCLGGICVVAFLFCLRIVIMSNINVFAENISDQVEFDSKISGKI